MDEGDVMVMDIRTQHHGTANLADIPRTILYIQVPLLLFHLPHLSVHALLQHTIFPSTQALPFRYELCLID